MCVIAVAEKTRPSLETLELMESRNPDGGGMAWIARGQVHYLKGKKFKAKQMFELSKSLPLPIIYHFRIATVGGKTNELCHPFPVTEQVSTAISGSADAVLFHNGTVTDWKQLIKGLISRKTRHGWRIPRKGEWSDSRALAVMANVHGPEVLEFLTDFQRIVYFAVDGIKLYGSWDKYEDMQVSNTHFKPYVPYVYAGTPPPGHWPAVGRGGYKDYGHGSWNGDLDDWGGDMFTAAVESLPKLPPATVGKLPPQRKKMPVIHSTGGPGLVWDEELKGWVSLALFNAGLSGE